MIAAFEKQVKPGDLIVYSTIDKGLKIGIAMKYEGSTLVVKALATTHNTPKLGPNLSKLKHCEVMVLHPDQLPSDYSRLLLKYYEENK